MGDRDTILYSVTEIAKSRAIDCHALRLRAMGRDLPNPMRVLEATCLTRRLTQTLHKLEGADVVFEENLRVLRRITSSRKKDRISRRRISLYLDSLIWLFVLASELCAQDRNRFLESSSLILQHGGGVNLLEKNYIPKRPKIKLRSVTERLHDLPGGFLGRREGSESHAGGVNLAGSTSSSALFFIA